MEDLKCEVLPDDYRQSDLNFKLIVLGDSGVGKSCLTTKATKNFFEETYLATVGFEYFNFIAKINNKIIKLQIWDTCGQEIYRSLISSFYRNSCLAIMVYSIDNAESFNHIDSWLKEIRKLSNPDIKIFCVGNKTDLENKRKISYEVGKQFVADNKLDYFAEASAKTGFNTQSVFLEAAKMLYWQYFNYRSNSKEDLFSERSSSYKANKKDSTSISSFSHEDKKGCC